jgi:hypothetical protein
VEGVLADLHVFAIVRRVLAGLELRLFAHRLHPLSLCIV